MSRKRILVVGVVCLALVLAVLPFASACAVVLLPELLCQVDVTDWDIPGRDS